MIMAPILGTPESEVDLMAILETISMEEDMDTWVIMVPVGVDMPLETTNMEEILDLHMDTVEPELDMVKMGGKMGTGSMAEMAILTVSDLDLSLVGQH